MTSAISRQVYQTSTPSCLVAARSNTRRNRTPGTLSEYPWDEETKQIVIVLILATGGMHLEPILHSPHTSDERRDIGEGRNNDMTWPVADKAAWQQSYRHAVNPHARH